MDRAVSGVPATLGHYGLVEKIGEGGMGEVYRAHDERLDRDVAIKLLPVGALADDMARKHFRKEALALSKLNHPNIETIHDFDSEQGRDFIVTEYIPGEGLDRKLASGALPEKEIARLGSQLAEGLAAAHEQGIIHRDLKPSNLRITPDGRLKILDFGVAKLTMPGSFDAGTASLSESMRFAGTLPYMAPEQVRGHKLDARTDIWAAGVVLYEMATGQRPFRATGLDVTEEILHQAPAVPSGVNPSVSSALDAAILKCLDKEAENRYHSARDLGVDLRRLSMPTAAATLPAKTRNWRVKVLTFAAVLLVAIAAAAYLYLVRKPHAVAARQITSMAVLPLANLSGDPNQEYFSDGMTEALITDLSKIKALKVISRTSIMQYKGVKKPLPQIARELGVEGIIEGSVLRSGDRVRITAQLIDAREDRHLWADSYDRDLRDVLALHSEVARAIAAQIQVTLVPAEERHLAGAGPVVVDAYNAYLRGRYFSERLSEENVGKAIGYYEQAVKLDPGYALAWASLAEARTYQAGFWATSLDYKEAVLAKARAEAERALSLKPDLAQAHAAMGLLQRVSDLDWTAADASYQKALALEPGNAAALSGAATMAAALGRFEQARELNRRAVELNPLDSSGYYRLAYTLSRCGRLDEADAALGRALELNPRHPALHLLLGGIYLAQSRPQQALAEMQKEADPFFRLQGEALAYHAMGRKKEADAALAELIGKGKETGAFQIAEVYAFRGETNKAFEWLEKAYSLRDSGLTYIKGNPLLKSLERDPRYAAFLKKIRLPT